MTHETLTFINIVVMSFAATASTGLVVLYLGLPWYKTAYGRALMFGSLAFAIAIDGRLLLNLFDISPPWSIGIEIGFHMLLAMAIMAKCLVVLNEYRKDYNAARKDRHASQ